MKKTGVLFVAVNIYAVTFLVLDVKEVKFIDELPVSTQMTVRCGSKTLSLRVREMTFKMDEPRRSSLALVLPHLTHECAVEVGLTA